MSNFIAIPTAAEHAVQFKYHIDKVPNDATIGYENAPKIFINGSVWIADVYRGPRKNFGAFIIPCEGAVNQSINYGVRLILDDKIHTEKARIINYKHNQVNIDGHCFSIRWDNLIADYSRNGEFTIEFFFPSVLSQRDKIHHLTLANAESKDVVVTCGDVSIDCNKSVIVLASELIKQAFADPDSEESLENKFAFSNDRSTPQNTRLLVDAMYEGWKRATMDLHANELLVVADAYQCSSIADMAIESLKRQLTVLTFWSTATTAVRLMDRRPQLVAICAEFAGSFNRIVDILNDNSPHDDRTVHVILKTMAASNK